MSTNDRVLLDGILKDRRTTIAPEMKEDDFFELFLAEQLLWARDLSWDELIGGIMGGGGDGGIDAMYIFLNGTLLASDAEVIGTRGNAHFELYIIQAKRSPGFNEVALDKIRSTLSELLDLGKEMKDIEGYNDDLVETITRFRDHYVSNASRFPEITIRIFYGTRGFDIHPNVQRKAIALKNSLEGLFSSTACSVEFVTPSDLIGLARRQRPTAIDLRVSEAIATQAGALVALVQLNDYFDFVTDEEGKLLGAMFESNVRDYEAGGKINAGIRSTLEGGESDDFWWLNNGVTVIASRAAQFGKTLTLEYPQIVNGLQTTREIFEYIDSQQGAERSRNRENRSVLVRVVVPPTDASRDRIIRATNSQAPIPSVALRATDKIQRDIEDYFLQYGFFYERRKNKYKNEGKPVHKIITISYVAEAVLAAVLNAAHLGRPRYGGAFLRDESIYHLVFNPERPLSLFLKSVLLAQRIEGEVNTHRGRYIMPTVMATSFICHRSGKSLDALDVDGISSETIALLAAVCQDVDLSSNRKKKTGKGGTDVVFAKNLIEELNSPPHVELRI